MQVTYDGAVQLRNITMPDRDPRSALMGWCSNSFVFLVLGFRGEKRLHAQYQGRHGGQIEVWMKRCLCFRLWLDVCHQALSRNQQIHAQNFSVEKRRHQAADRSVGSCWLIGDTMLEFTRPPLRYETSAAGGKPRSQDILIYYTEGMGMEMAI